MRSKIQLGLISALGMVFLFAGMAFAKTKNIDVIYHATVGKSLSLKPGKYRIDVTNNAKNMSEVQFFNRYGHLLGQVPAKVVDKSQKNHQTRIDYDKLASNRELLTGISPRGWKEKLVFNHMSTSQATTKQ